MADRLLLEAGVDAYQLEDASGVLILETAPQTDALAQVATGTGSAAQPSAKIAPAGGLSAGTGAIGVLGVSQTTVAGLGAGTGAAPGEQPSLAPNAGAGAGTGNVPVPAVALAPYAGIGAGTSTGVGAAGDARTGAFQALGTGTALSPTVKSTATAGVGTGTGAATSAHNDPVAPGAVRAEGFGTAYLASPGTGTAGARGGAYDGTVASVALDIGFQPDAFQGGAFQGGAVPNNKSVPAATATGTGTAFNARGVLAAGDVAVGGFVTIGDSGGTWQAPWIWGFSTWGGDDLVGVIADPAVSFDVGVATATVGDRAA